MVTSGPSLAKLATAPMAHLHPDDAARLGVAEGEAVTVRSGNVEAVLAAAIDSSLAPRTVYVPFNFGLGLGGSGDVTVTAGGGKG
jgi:anaerobic selenocysteine-containing dehydrogenase